MRFITEFEFVLSENEGTEVGREEDIKDGKELTEFYSHIEACEEKEAVAFGEWIRANHYNPYGNAWRRTGSNMEQSSAQLYELFKQQKEK